MGITRLPFATVIVGALLVTLTACGGQPLVFNANPASSSSENSSIETTESSDSSSSTPTNSSSTLSSSVSSGSTSVTSNSSSSRSSSSSSRSSSSRSSSISSSSVSGPTGAQLYTSLGCNVCHGATGAGTIIGDPLVGAGCASCANATLLAQIITTTMPQGSVGTCDATCGSKIAAFILGGFSTSSNQITNLLLKQSASESASIPANSLLANTESSCEVAYSANDLRPLTKQEYSSAILQITGVDVVNDLGQSTYDALPPDNLISELFNNVKITIDSDALQSYNVAANKIAGILSSHNFNEIVDCANASNEECYNRLVDGFGCKAFRRPLTTEERANYLSLYKSSLTDGTKKVVEAILSSSNFIYRSDIGLSIIDATNSLENAQALIDTTKTISIYQHNTVNANFTGNDVLEITVKGTQSVSGLWPTMRIQVGNSTFVDIIINQTAPTTYRFHITSLTGNNNIMITNQQTGAPLEYQAGHNLIVSSIKLLSSD